MNMDFTWRSVGAFVYFFICIVDLVVMPLYREYNYNKLTVSEIVSVAKTLPDSVSQIEAMQIFKSDRAWQPVTNEMFHLSFAAILGVAALPSNRKRKQNDDEEEPKG